MYWLTLLTIYVVVLESKILNENELYGLFKPQSSDEQVSLDASNWERLIDINALIINFSKIFLYLEIEYET